ncbi:PH domain-containing protein [Aeromonas veronii]|uniref:PH domain-containing protein n=1 Tax=Aeromonas TaxID=642 RepID=UPI00191FE726|nr:PH domain-containing protein [Aeromonas jandaei]MBL0597595.1 PH domain-containing protein [Aeromonas jandaei]
MVEQAGCGGRGATVKMRREGELHPGEYIVYRGSMSLASSFVSIFFALILLPFYGVGLFFLLIVAIRHSTTFFVVTNMRVIAKHGFFYCKTIDLLLLKVEKVQVNQGIIARIFNYGSVVFFGASGKIDVFAGATEPLKLRDIILRVILNESR